MWAGTPVRVAAAPEASLPHHAFLDVGAGMAKAWLFGHVATPWPQGHGTRERPHGRITGETVAAA
jgi:hypothetical protein